MTAASASPLTAAKPARSGLGCAFLFAVVFAAAGFAAFWFATLRPLLRFGDSAGWVETPCEILASSLERHTGSDSTTYRVAVRYRYTFDGRAYESDRYDFSSGSTNVGVDRMRAAVNALPPGRRAVCYVDPADPASAVLSRAPTSGVWFGFLTLLFPAFGAALVILAWKGAKKAKAETRSPLNAAPPSKEGVFRVTGDSVPSGEVVLKPAAGRIGTFIGLTFFALFWNGIVGVFVYQAVKEFGRGFIGWFLPVFLIPFVLIGLLVLGAAMQAFSRLFAPPVEVRLDPSRLRLGARLPFTWRLGGRGVRKLTIRLVAREEATYRQGTRTSTDKSDFLRAVLFESTDVLSLAEGRSDIVLPAELVAPAFAATNNKIVWELVFDGEIPWRADVDDRFVLPVRGPENAAPVPEAPEPRAHEGGGLTLWTVDRFAPEETLVFTLSRATDAKPGPLTLQLGWFTEGRGTRDADIVWSERIDDLAPGADRGFEVRLPEAPWSFAGKLVAVSWRLEALDARGEPLLALPITVGPGGAPVTLPALPPEPSAFQKRKARYLAGRRP